MDGGSTRRTRLEGSVFSGVIFSTDVAFMVHSSVRPGLAGYRGAAMSTIQKHAPGSPVKFEQPH